MQFEKLCPEDECDPIYPSYPGQKNGYKIEEIQRNTPKISCRPLYNPPIVTSQIIPPKFFAPCFNYAVNLSSTVTNIDTVIPGSGLFVDSITPSDITKLWISFFTLNRFFIRCNFFCLKVGDIIRIQDLIDATLYNDFKVTSITYLASGVILEVTLLVSTSVLTVGKVIELCFIPNLGTSLNYPASTDISSILPNTLSKLNLVGISVVNLLMTSYFIMQGSILDLILNFTGTITVVGANSFQVDTLLSTVQTLFGSGSIIETGNTIVPLFAELTGQILTVKFTSTALGAFSGSLRLSGPIF